MKYIYFTMADKIGTIWGSQLSSQKMLLEDMDGRADQVYILGDLRD